MSIDPPSAMAARKQTLKSHSGLKNPAWYICPHPCNARYLSVYSNRIHSKNAQQIFIFRGDRRADNDDNPRKWCFESFLKLLAWEIRL